MHSAVQDDKGCGDSASCLCLGLAVTLYGRHCQVKGTYSLKEDRLSFVLAFCFVSGYAFSLWQIGLMENVSINSKTP